MKRAEELAYTISECIYKEIFRENILNKVGIWDMGANDDWSDLDINQVNEELKPYTENDEGYNIKIISITEDTVTFEISK